MEFPLVTILAISYNQEKYIRQTLDSIKAQTYKNIQLIIADDGSADNTKTIIKDWITNTWPDCIFLDHQVNKGVTKNLNSALPYIKGDFYQFIGCEDMMMPDKIERQVALLAGNNEYDIVYSDMVRIDEHGKLYELSHYKANSYNIPQSGFIYENLIDRCFVATPTALMRTKVLFTLGGDNEALQVNDYDFWLRAAKQFKFLYDETPTMQYRIISTSISNKRGCFVFRNGFSMFYLNYDNRKPYRQKFDQRLFHGIKNLAGLKCKDTTAFAVKAFFKTRKPGFIKYALRGLPFLFSGK
jgi:glycosyltransferase involved in cell wall biosynthesis